MNHDILKKRLLRELNASDDGILREDTIFKMFKHQLTEKEFQDILDVLIQDNVIQISEFQNTKYIHRMG